MQVPIQPVAGTALAAGRNSVAHRLTFPEERPVEDAMRALVNGHDADAAPEEILDCASTRGHLELILRQADTHRLKAARVSSSPDRHRTRSEPTTTQGVFLCRGSCPLQPCRDCLRAPGRGRVRGLVLGADSGRCLLEDFAALRVKDFSIHDGQPRRLGSGCLIAHLVGVRLVRLDSSTTVCVAAVSSVPPC